MIPFKRVPYQDADKCIKDCKNTGDFIYGYKIRREGNFVLIPCKSGNELGDFVKVTEEKMTHTGSFERIADFFVIKEREGWQKTMEEIAKKQKPRAIFLDTGVIGNERRRNVLRVYGTGNPEGIHRENGIRLMVDIEKAYFSPRLGGIREHILSNVLEYRHERVIDMYAGIGPISILLLKNGINTYSFDMNPYAIQLLRMNMKLNNVKGNYALTDSNAIASCFKNIDHIIMNNPTQTEDISRSIIEKFPVGTCIHYFFIEKKDTLIDFENIEIIERREVHGYSPSSSLFYYFIKKI